MKKTVRNALNALVRLVARYRASGWTADNRPVRIALARYDRILARWPHAYGD